MGCVSFSCENLVYLPSIGIASAERGGSHHVGPPCGRSKVDGNDYIMACVFVLLSTSSPAPTCHLRSPRRCGPLISPGGHQLSVLTPSAHPPPNLLYVSRTRAADAAADAAAVRAGATAVSTIRSNATALVCVPAKAGSTSFYFWLFHALSGAPWPYSGPPWIQDVSSARWANLSGVRVSRFDKMALRQRIRALSDPLIKRACPPPFRYANQPL
jgi:hypothetical protein